MSHNKRWIQNKKAKGRKLFEEFEELMDCKRSITIRLILPLSTFGESTATGMTTLLPREFKRRNNERD